MSGVPGSVMTVKGAIDPTELGVTMTHEHLFCDLACWQAPPHTPLQESLAHAPISIEFLGELRRDALVFADNLVLHDEEIVVKELQDLFDAGGRSIIDLTVTGLEPAAAKLQAVAERTDLHIVAGCGYYIGDSHPPTIRDSSAESIAQDLIQQIRFGIGSTNVLPGVIGEIGTGQPVTVDEWKVLEAACYAQRETDLPLFIHVYPMLDGSTAPSITEFILDQGVLASRVNICHMDGRMDIPYLKSVLDMGVYISFDTFGIEAYYDAIDRRSRFDSEREVALLSLLELGYAPQLLLSQDVCMKMQLRHYGGMGYSHILRHIVPSLRRRGVGDDVIDVLLRENAMRLLRVEDDQRVASDAAPAHRSAVPGKN
jgi:phosphotriesterase-related protein